MKKVGIITQARMTSTRLPGKILMKANGKPLLDYHFTRLKKSGLPFFVATTVNATDDPVVEFCQANSIPYSRGSEANVLSRFYNCATENKLDVIVRVTSDCPLIDGEVVRKAVDQYLALNDNQVYLSNALERTFPRGFDFEIFSFELLNEAYHNATLELEKEHVTPYINRNKSGKVKFVHYKQDSDNSSYRITVDTPEDFELVKILIEQYQAESKNYKEVITILDNHPELVAINAHIEQKKS